LRARGDRARNAPRRVADRPHDGFEDHEAPAGRRHVRGVCRCERDLGRDVGGDPGIHDPYDRGSDRRRGHHATPVGGSLGRRRACGGGDPCATRREPTSRRKESPRRLKISQRTDAFFELFSKSAVNSREAVTLLRDLVDDYRDVELKARRIQEREHDGDEITHDVIRRLNTTFITPMDREDIYTLATALDDVLDAVEEAADVFVLHNIVEPKPWMIQQVDVLLHAAEQTEHALRALPSLDRSEEHTSELQSRVELVCRLLLEKKKDANVSIVRV